MEKSINYLLFLNHREKNKQNRERLANSAIISFKYH